MLLPRFELNMPFHPWTRHAYEQSAKRNAFERCIRKQILPYSAVFMCCVCMQLTR